MTELERMKELAETLNQASRAYYQEDREIMSNLQYDDYYNGLAEDYNRVCDGFPASVIGALTGAGKLPTFR